MRATDTLLAGLEGDAPVRELVVGAHWTAVLLATDPPRCGLASTLCRQGAPGRPAGAAAGVTARELAGGLGSSDLVRSSTGMAAFNALLEVDEAACAGVNGADLLVERGAGKQVAVVGHFPFVEHVREAAAECWVLEQHPRPGDVPAAEAERLLPRADVVALTGTSLINGTFDGLLALCRPDAFVLLLGPSAPLSPLLLELGVDAVGGTLVTDPGRVLPLVAEGATFRQIKRSGGVRVVVMRG